MRSALEKLGARIYQTYRIYEYPLVEGEAVSPPVSPGSDGPAPRLDTPAFEG
jgi:hypothetical protein